MTGHNDDSAADWTSLGGCRLSRATKEDILQAAAAWIGEGRRGMTVMPVNVTKLVMMQKDPKVAAALGESAAVIADGFPVYLAAKIVGRPVAERITGVEFMEDLLRLAHRKGFSAFFFGSRQKVLDAVLARVRRELPGVRIAGSRSGYYSPTEEEGIVAAIAKTAPDILLLGLGLPQKEHFVASHRNELGSAVILPVGGAFDVYSGAKKRAPQRVQALGIEWLWRSLYDPSRAALVARNAVPFAAIVLRELWRQRIPGKAG